MAEAKKFNILITGVSGYLGTSLAEHFLNNKSIGKIVGTDICEAPINSDKFIFEKVDIRDKEKHIELLRRHGISQVFHFAFVMGEVKDQEKAISVNVEGTRAIIEAAKEVKTVKRIVFAGSVSAYGANKSNKLYIKESHPLQANTLRYGVSKKLMEEEIARIKPYLRKDLKLLLLRICTIVGPTERKGGAVETFLSMPFSASLIGHDCPLQFVHEEDLLPIFDKVLPRVGFSGIYNVAPREYTTLKEISEKLGKAVLPIPYGVLYLIFYLLFRISPSLGISENSVSYLAYPIVVDSSKIEKELGVTFQHSSLDAFMDCAKALQGG